MSAFRWLLALVSPACGYAITIAGAILLINALELLCPPELMVSGVCTASWYPASEKAAFALASFFGALVFVTLPVFTAPSYKFAVAWAAFGAGLAIASAFLWHGGKEVLAAFAAALFGGAVGALGSKRKQPNAA
jgi:hypothetical protein